MGYTRIGSKRVKWIEIFKKRIEWNNNNNNTDNDNDNDNNNNSNKKNNNHNHNNKRFVYRQYPNVQRRFTISEKKNQKFIT